MLLLGLGLGLLGVRFSESRTVVCLQDMTRPHACVPPSARLSRHPYD